MKTTTRRIFSSLLAIALVSSAALVSYAGTINHGDFMGAGVAYTSVTESSNTDSVPLFGTPVVVGNELRFFEPVPLPNPSLGFGALSVGGVSDVTDGFLSFMVLAKQDLAISKIKFNEGGDYSLAGFDGDQAKVIANLIIQSVRIDEVDGIAVAPISLSGLDTEMHQLGMGPAFGLWDNMAMFNIDGALAANGYPATSGATKLTVRLNDSLLALSQASSAANIIKKVFNISTDTRTNMVPEPATMALALLSMVGFATSRRR